MGKREELIEAAARAIAHAVMAQSDNGVPEKASDWRNEAASTLDAILAGLKKTTPEMLDAADMADELEGDYPDGRNRAIWKAMLSTLEETKP